MRTTIGVKIFGVAILVLCVMLAVGFYSLQAVGRLNEELKDIAHKDIPLAALISDIHALTLEQGVDIQRFFLLQEGGHGGDGDMSSRLLKGEFERLRLKIEKDFIKANAIAESLQDRDRLNPILLRLQKGYMAFLHQAEVMMEQGALSDQGQFDVMFHELNRLQDTIDGELARFEGMMQDRSVIAVVRAQKEEDDLLVVTTLLMGFATVAATLLALLFTSVMVRAVKKLVRGTQEVSAGALDVHVPVSTNDEIADLTRSFNDMTGQLQVKDRLQKNFDRYLDPRIVERLVAGDGLMQERGESREMTVMFADLKGFTSLSEKVPANHLIAVINLFFTKMTGAINRNNGVVDKFMGDCVMAYWGPPFCDPARHADLASYAALEAHHVFSEFLQDATEITGLSLDEMGLDIRIGLSTGQMTVGPIGSDRSKSYTVMGDAVNFGARLEGANKIYGTHILISERTQALLSDAFVTRSLDIVRVKGKEQPRQIYELRPIRDNDQQWLDQFDQAVTAYQAKELEQAKALFTMTQSMAQQDGPTHTYLQRLAYLEDHPPRHDWDGVWDFDVK